MNRNDKRGNTKASNCIASAIRILQRPCQQVGHETFRELQNVYRCVKEHEEKQDGRSSRG